MSTSTADARSRLATARRVVVKVGTNVILRDDGAVALGRIYGLIESVANLRRAGRDVAIVSSGAVGLGAERLRLGEKKKSTVLKQACAAVGQSRLMAIYDEGFARLGLEAAQILVTEGDFSDRARYLNLRATLDQLFELGVVPILNENDTVSTAELETPIDGRPRERVFGDNDKLSALVASKIEADLLVLLSDVDGLFTANPRRAADARLLEVVEDVDAVRSLAEAGASRRGRGGMPTKLEAARIATHSGSLAVIANGRTPMILDRLFAGEALGTLFLPATRLSGRRRWIAWAASAAGTLIVNEGARRALEAGKASLLAAGVTAMSGEWRAGEIVTIRDGDGRELGRGRVAVDSAAAAALIGQSVRTGARRPRALVDRNDIVWVGEAQG